MERLNDKQKCFKLLHCHHMAVILPINHKTLINQSINQSINHLEYCIHFMIGINEYNNFWC